MSALAALVGTFGTFQRRLKAAGVTYDELLDTTRHGTGGALPQASHLSLTEIGSLLGYADLAPSAAHFGMVRCSPQAFRRNAHSVCHRKPSVVFRRLLEQAGDESSAAELLMDAQTDAVVFDILAAEHAVAQRAAFIASPLPNKGERRHRLELLKRSLLATKMRGGGGIADFGGHSLDEVMLAEIFPLIEASNAAIKHVGQWMKPSSVE